MYGGDLDEKIDVSRMKSRAHRSFQRNCWGLVMHGYKMLYGGYLNESGNVEEGRLVVHGSKISCGVILTIVAILRRGYQSCLVTKFAWERS